MIAANAAGTIFRQLREAGAGDSWGGGRVVINKFGPLGELHSCHQPGIGLFAAKYGSPQVDSSLILALTLKVSVAAREHRASNCVPASIPSEM